LPVHEASQSLLARKRLEFLRIKSRMFRQLLEGGFEDFKVQSVFAFEIIIDGRLFDARFDDYVADARTLEALLREQIDGGLDNSPREYFQPDETWFSNSNGRLNGCS
jgi:hypothetical protein